MRRYAVLVLALLLAACNLSVPQVTPTVAPSLTPSTTPLVTFTPSATPNVTVTEVALLPTLTSTAIPSETDTPAPTLTPSDTPTGTLPPTQTPTDTLTPTATPTQSPTPSETPTATDTLPPTVTDTQPPPTPSPLPLPTQTPTSTDTPVPSATLTPTIPPRPSDTVTPVPSLTSTVTTVAIGPLIMLTPQTLPSPMPPPVTTAAPTLDVTPTFITVEAPSLSIETPIPATVPPIIEPLPTSLPAFIPTAQIAVIPQGPTGLPLPQTGPGTFAYALSTNGSNFDFGVFDLGPGFSVDTFAQNPANPNQYAAVNSSGQLFFIGDYANRQSDRVHLDIFTEYTYQVTAREDNDAAVDRVIWSPNGQYMAFIIHAGKVNKDGVWYYSPSSGGNQILRDCPPLQGCETTANRGQEGRPAQYQSLNVHWSPNSDALLIELYLPEENRRAFAVSNGLAVDPSIMPPVLRYDYANWSSDAQRVVVAGHAPDGRLVLGTVDRNGVNEQLNDMGALGWAWVQDGVDYRNQLVALGSKSGPDSPQQIVDQTGRALSDPIGSAKPERVDWSPDHSAVLVVTNEGGGRRYWVARLGEQRPREITGQVANALTVEWVTGGRLPSNPIVPPQAAPTTAPVASVAPTVIVVPTSAPQGPAPAFVPGQQVTVNAPAGLNMRLNPTVASDLLLMLPDAATVVIVEGPVEQDGYPWYRIRLEDGTEGWVAALVNGVPTLQ